MQNTAAKLSWFTRLLQRTSVLNSVNYNHINDIVAYKFICIYCKPVYHHWRAINLMRKVNTCKFKQPPFNNCRQIGYLIEVKLSSEMSCYTFNDPSHFHHNIVVPNMHHTAYADTLK